MRGKLIAFEGGDANGKNTQSSLLAAKLDALLISFPRYETEIGKLIRENLRGEWEICRYNEKLDQDFRPDTKANHLVRQALFTLDRYDAASQILDALDNGRNVVADRYWLSGLMYGASDLVDSGMLERVHQCLPQPDVWVLLDVPVEESFRRRPERTDVYECDREKLEGIRQRYLKVFEEEQHDVVASKAMANHLNICGGCDLDREIRQRVRQKWVVVDGVGTIEQVHERVMEVIK